MTPSIDGEIHTFAEHGLYDGLFLMRDDQTETFWDHMTGDAVYGELVGEKLEVSNLLQTTVAQVMGEDSDALITLSDQAIRRDSDMSLRGLLSIVGGGLNRMFQSTVADDDERLTQMDIGLGVWQADKARYYPYNDIVADGAAVVDDFEGRRILVYLDPTAFALSALYVDSRQFEWDDRILRLSNGTYIEGGILHNAEGERIEMERPLQVFTRWYGFSLTFPETEIYGR